VFQWMKRKLCSHEFSLSDLKTVNNLGGDDRVAWPCRKCGKVFRAHCGLDISPKHGYIVNQQKGGA
jgi:hypothetical protein